MCTEAFLFAYLFCKVSILTFPVIEPHFITANQSFGVSVSRNEALYSACFPSLLHEIFIAKYNELGRFKSTPQTVLFIGTVDEVIKQNHFI